MRILRTGALIGALAALLTGAATAQPAPARLPPPSPARVVPQSATQMQLSFAPVVAKVAPAVVNVYARSVVNVYARSVVRQAANPLFNDPFFRQFFGGQARERVQQSLGSGVIVRGDGIILTNNHVIAGGQDIKVALPDRREFEAKVVLADPRTDLAVLRIDAKGEKLPALTFGDSDKTQVGDLVLAIGDPFGVGQTVTSGIVSALARTEGGASDYQFFIQTDAAINPGNSGGALVTLDGKLIGINTSIVSQSGGSVGIGFAIPANMAKLVVDGALNGGVKRPWFGAQAQAVTADIARSLGLARPQGVLVAQVYPGGPASAAGIVKGDVVLSIDGFEINDQQGLNYRVATHRPGDMAKVKFLHNGATRDMTVTVNVPPDTARDETVLAGRNPMQGAKVANITPALADELQMDFSAHGVVVVAVDDASQSANFGFQPGDIVRQINGQAVDTVAALKRALTSDRGWNIAIQRGNQTLSLSIN